MTDNEATDLTYMLTHCNAAMLCVHDYLSLVPPPAATAEHAQLLAEISLDYLRDALALVAS